MSRIRKTASKFGIPYAIPLYMLPPVWRIRDFYPGSDFFPSRIPDPNCLYPGSRILIKEFKNLKVLSSEMDPTEISLIR
jgi:hypothetical protein